ncbi:MAG: hypothetical protein GX810_09870 [Clostridiales bacterium]|nr:hypothetical protein [Clostridiales bacterium]
MITREPDFGNMLKVMRREVPDRPVLFELFMNYPLYELVVGHKLEGDTALDRSRFVVEAFAKMGYDYAHVVGSSFGFPTGHHPHLQTSSLNDGSVIVDRESYEKYVWPDPEDTSFDHLREIRPYLPDGMKLMVLGPGGVLENAISLMGYDRLCYLLSDDPELVHLVFDQIGSRLLSYYRLALQHDTVGLISANDDWGFNTQTFLSPAQMREYVLPWHAKIVELSHKHGRPVFLHSCGQLITVMDDVIAMGFDAKHSFEDVILPIEEAYEKWHSRIALLGGLDMNFVCTRPPEEVYARARGMLERSETRGGYALGTGNSIPEYVPVKAFFEIIRAATGEVPL